MLGFLKSDKKPKMKEGDGRPLKALRWWEMMTRSVFYLNQYAVEVYFFRFEDNIMVYRNGRQVAKGTESLKYEVAETGGQIEIALSDYGVKRMHYKEDTGQEQMLIPDKQSAEGLRYRFGQRFPRVSKWIGWIAVAILLASVVLWIPQIVGLLGEWAILESYIGGFESPVQLPAWLNTTLVVLSLLAVIERTLTVKYHWLIDMDTASFDE